MSLDDAEGTWESHGRRLTSHEEAIVLRLLSADFQGVRALRQQALSMRARTVDADGSLELWVDPSADPANTKFAVPVEGYTPDEDGVMVHYLLHVSVDGFMNELEVYREDSHRPIAVIDPERLEVLAL